MSRARLEIWTIRGGKPGGTIGTFEAHAPLQVGQVINAASKDYTVVKIDWSIDNALDVMRSALRQNVYVEPSTGGSAP